ncbi:hypothetical protein ACWAYJ_000036 [Shigella sonnei]|uniref:Transcriptional regulator n=3 Tax=Tequatrovirus TaxID=10663 RepID=A0A0M7QAZ0_9CAUD|nr:MotB-like transcriptional regulator [Escherichia phage slur07]YP_009210202.1 MotB-like transcriptional regulator [Escherichia phage slur02]YP_009625499.1 MotB-like transcriptional regulator [Escherichia phage slur04]CUL03053.1 hypothetical protein [Escherichia phage slur11]CUL03573.1 hypothetical protein [Escherichia phage slur13]CUL01245.1 MotB modifier of transcription [Enterobacteria phage T4] [Escherichia phage slur02]CUL02125.1 hypothetical protein [Escherichia phage slur04]CUL02500.
MIINIGELARVSDKSRSKAAGKLVEIVSIQLKHGVKDEDSEVKVRIIPKDGKSKPQFGYVRAKFLESAFLKAVPAKVIETIDTSHVGVDFKWKLGQAIKFIAPCEFKFIKDDGKAAYTRAMCGYITDQWVEDGVKLYNVVFLGTYKVIPESWIKHYSNALYA